MSLPEDSRELVITKGQLTQLIMPALRAHLYTNKNTMPKCIVINCPSELSVKDQHYVVQTIPMRIAVEEKADDTGRQRRAGRVGTADKSVSTNNTDGAKSE